MEKFDIIFNIFKNKYGIKIGKVLGKGGFGEVREIINKNKTYAGKLVKKNCKARKTGSESDNDQQKDNIILKLKSTNIVQIYNIYDEIYKEKDKEEIYNLIVMEKAVLKDLKTFIKSLFYQNIDHLMYIPFKDIIGDNLLKYFCLQLVKGLEYFDRNNLIHFDIKPENILIFLELSLKLSDFGLLKDTSEIDKIRIPGGTPGYLSPEYYKNQKIKLPVEIAKKQDYFALGVTIFFIKYGKSLIKNRLHKSNKSEENKVNQEYIIDTLQKQLVFIKSDKLSDKDFVKFLCSLIQIEPEERPSFEEIYRDKWLNKNLDELKKVLKCFGNDEPKFLIEIRKSDFLFEKKKDLEKDKNKKKKFIFIPKNKK